jgi:hypothetical protein
VDEGGWPCIHQEVRGASFYDQPVAQLMAYSPAGLKLHSLLHAPAPRITSFAEQREYWIASPDLPIPAAGVMNNIYSAGC